MPLCAPRRRIAGQGAPLIGAQMTNIKCCFCGRSLRSPETRANGYGATCGRKHNAKAKRLAGLIGEPGQGLLFPDHDKPAIDAAIDEVTK